MSKLPVCLCIPSGACRAVPPRQRIAADSYAGKTIELIVGAPPGGGYDIYARAVARHLGRHIPGRAERRGQEHAGRRLRQGRAIHLHHRAEGRHLDRRHHAGRDHGPAARRPHRAAVRSDQGALRRHRQQRHPRLRHAEERQDPEVRGRAEGEVEVRRQRAERFDLRIRLPAQAHVGRAVGHRAGLSRHAGDGARHGARRDRRHLRLGLVELQIAEAGLAARQQGQRADAGQPRSASRC